MRNTIFIRGGFTLMEILVVTGISALLMSLAVTLLLSSQRVWLQGAGEAVVSTELRKAFDRMSRELSNSPVDQIQSPPADGRWYTSILFRIPQDQNGDGSVLNANGNIAEWSTWVRYLRGGTNGNNLIRRLSTAPTYTEDLIGYHVTDVEFRRQAATPDMVEIQVTAAASLDGRRTVSQSMSSRVKLRNMQSRGVPNGELPPTGF